MASLEGVLANIPGLAGYLAQNQVNQQQGAQSLNTVGTLVQLQAAIRKQQEDQALKATLAQSGGDLEKALPALIQSGNLKGAQELAPILKLQQERQQTEETRKALTDLYGQSGQASPTGLDVPPGTPETTDAKRARLQKMSIIYAKNPAAQTAIQKELDRLDSEKNAKYQMLPISNNREQLHRVEGNTLVPVGQPRDVFAPKAGNTKNTFLQDVNTGKKYSLDNDGNAYEAQPDGSWKSIPFDSIPASAQRLGAGGGALGNRESVFINRVILSGNEAARDLENVTKMPLSASRGVFGGRQQGAGLMSAGMESLANRMTTQEVQSYNVFATGFQRSLAAIEAAGLAPSGTLTHQMDAVIAKEGDSNLTKLQKLAQIRQIVEAGLETITANPRVPDATKKHIETITQRIEKSVPFTQGDLIEFEQQVQKNPSLTLKTFIESKKKSTSGSIFDQADKIINGGR